MPVDASLPRASDRVRLDTVREDLDVRLGVEVQELEREDGAWRLRTSQGELRAARRRAAHPVPRAGGVLR